jgi:lipoprotein NlpD
VSRAGLAFLLGCALLLGSCGAIYALRHRVAPGETLYSIAKAHGTTVGELRALNRLDPDDVLRPGDFLFLPAPGPAPRTEPKTVPNHSSSSASAKFSSQALPAKPPGSEPRPPPPSRRIAAGAPERTGPAKALPRPQAAVRNPDSDSRQVVFRWPVPGKILRSFAFEERGIDLHTSQGEAVRSAASGKVSYAGTPARAYGAMVILDHEGDWYTVYSNLHGLGVRSGQVLAANEILGLASDFLHFEIRRGSAPKDPLLFLPPR